MRLNAYLLGSTLVAALAGFSFGFDTVVISGTTKMLVERFGLSPAELGFTVASALIGTVVGSLIAGKPAEWLGRKPVLMWLAVLYFVSAPGVRAGLELVRAAEFPPRGRAGDRRSLGGRAAVHR